MASNMTVHLPLTYLPHETDAAFRLRAASLGVVWACPTCHTQRAIGILKCPGCHSFENYQVHSPDFHIPEPVLAEITSPVVASEPEPPPFNPALAHFIPVEPEPVPDATPLDTLNVTDPLSPMGSTPLLPESIPEPEPIPVPPSIEMETPANELPQPTEPQQAAPAEQSTTNPTSSDAGPNAGHANPAKRRRKG